MNVYKDFVKIQEKTTTAGPLGETITWKPVGNKYALVIPLDAKARAVYQQLQSLVTHKIIFNKGISISLGNNRILHSNKTYEPVEPPQIIENSTVVVCKEV